MDCRRPRSPTTAVPEGARSVARFVARRRSPRGSVRPGEWRNRPANLPGHLLATTAGLAGREKSGSAELGVAGPEWPARGPGRPTQEFELRAGGAERPRQVRVGPARERRPLDGREEPDRWRHRGDRPGPVSRRAVRIRCWIAPHWTPASAVSHPARLGLGWALARDGRHVQTPARFRLPALWMWRGGVRSGVFGRARVKGCGVGRAQGHVRSAVVCRSRVGEGVRRRPRGGQAVDARLAQAAGTPAPESAPTAAVDRGDGDRWLRSRLGVHTTTILSKRLPVV